MHCDTLMHVMLRQGTQTDMLHLPDAMVDISRMCQGDVLAQFFAIFVIPQDAYRGGFQMEPLPDGEYIRRCEELFHYNMELHSDIIGMAVDVADIRANAAQGKMSALLSIEDSGFVKGSLSRIRQCYEEGVRVMGLTWNFKNCFGSPNSTEAGVMREGLTTFGKEAVEYMNDIGMGIDVSHLSDGGFYDVAEISKKPFFATHSNSREVCRHPRNLSDEMIRILAEKGGVMGLNFCPEFLREENVNHKSRIEDMVRMVRHAYRVGGVQVVGIGSDLDGIRGDMEIKDCSMFDRLYDALLMDGFSEDQIDQFTYKNTFRVLEDIK